MKKNRANCLITLIPGMFMTFVVLTYILWISPAHGGPLGKPPLGFGLDLHVSYVLAILIAVLTTAWSIWHGRKLAAETLPEAVKTK